MLPRSLLPLPLPLRGHISSIGLMPVTFILPPIMWLRARSPGGAERALCLLIIVACSIIAVLSFIGSARNIAVLASQSGLFAGAAR